MAVSTSYAKRLTDQHLGNGTAAGANGNGLGLAGLEHGWAAGGGPLPRAGGAVPMTTGEPGPATPDADGHHLPGGRAGERSGSAGQQWRSSAHDMGADGSGGRAGPLPPASAPSPAAGAAPRASASAFRRYGQPDTAAGPPSTSAHVPLFGSSSLPRHGSFPHLPVGGSVSGLGRRSASSPVVRATVGLLHSYRRAGYGYSLNANPRRVLTKPSAGVKNEG